MKKLRLLCKTLRARREGITLIEMVVSIGLLAIVAIVMAQIMLASMAANLYTQKHTQRSLDAAGGVAADSDTNSTAADGTQIVTSTTSSTVTITFGNGSTASVAGNVTTGTVTTNGGGQTIYQSFEPTP